MKRKSVCLATSSATVKTASLLPLLLLVIIIIIIISVIIIALTFLRLPCRGWGAAAVQVRCRRVMDFTVELKSRIH